MGCSTPERQVGSCSPSLPSPVTFYLPKMCWSFHRQSAPLSCLYPFKLFCHRFYKVSRGSRDKPEVCSPCLTSPPSTSKPSPPDSLAFDAVFPAPCPSSPTHLPQPPAHPVWTLSLLLAGTFTFTASERHTHVQTHFKGFTLKFFLFFFWSHWHHAGVPTPEIKPVSQQ